ncbi:MAG: DUF1320 family protein [Clostridia bacterium]|nr:DUF1320 family protein [Clostridia bacterium]
MTNIIPLEDFNSVLIGHSYCSRTDMERRWGRKCIQMWADIDNDGDETKISEQIAWAITCATSQIDADFASSIYRIPFNPVPTEVRKHVAALAGVQLFKCRAMSATNDSPTVRMAEVEYEEWKIRIFSGIEIPNAIRRNK